jgi:hypothetical protein
MQLAAANVDPDSADYQVVQKELTALEAKLPKTPQQETAQGQGQQTAPTQLQEPSPLPSPLPGGPIELPSEETSTNGGSTSPAPTKEQNTGEGQTQESTPPTTGSSEE